MPVLTHAAEGKVHDRKDFRPGTEVKVLDDELGVVEAIVSVTNVLDDVNDIIEAGAYSATLKNRRPKGVWSHDWDLPIARTLDVVELMPGDPRLPEKIQAIGGGGLLVKMQFNLNTQRGRDAYADVKFFGEAGEQEWSIGYSVPPGEAKVDTKSGIRYIKALDLFEYSPVLFGANAHTDTLSIKAAVGEHKTGTSDDEWVEKSNRVNLPDDVDVLRKAYAWANPDSDPGTKDAYAFMHHFVSAEGGVNDASTEACARGISVLSGLGSIPDAEKQGVYDHLAKHLRDAGQEPVPFENVVAKADADDEVKVAHGFLPFYEDESKCSVCGDSPDGALHKAVDDNSPGMIAHEYQPPAGGEDNDDAPCLVCGLPEDDPLHPNDDDEDSEKSLEGKPYHIEKRDDEYCVIGGESGTRNFGCHPSRAEAEDQMRALYANTDDGKAAPPPCDGWFSISIGERASAKARCARTMDHAGPCGFADQEEAVTTSAVKETTQPAGGDAAQQAEGEGMPDAERRAAEGGAGTISPEEQAAVIEADVEAEVEGEGQEKSNPAPQPQPTPAPPPSPGGPEPTPAPPPTQPQPTAEGKSEEQEPEAKGDGDEGGDGNSSHAKFDGTHTHAHDTNKPGGGNHTHSHTHDGDADHGHGHPKKEAEVEDDEEGKVGGGLDVTAEIVEVFKTIHEAAGGAISRLTAAAAAKDEEGEEGKASEDDSEKGDPVPGADSEEDKAAEGLEEKIDVTLTGSFEDTAVRVQSAVSANLPAPSQEGSEQVAWIEATFADHVLVAVAEFSISEPDEETGMGGGIEFLGQQYLSFPYSVAEGVVNLGEPEPVEVSGVVTPRKALEERLEAKMTAAIEDKVGRTLSSANAEKIRGAVRDLIDVLKAAGIEVIETGDAKAATEDEAEEKAAESTDDAEEDRTGDVEGAPAEGEAKTAALSMTEILRAKQLALSS